MIVYKCLFVFSNLKWVKDMSSNSTCLAIYNNNMYASSYTGNTIYQIDLSTNNSVTEPFTFDSSFTSPYGLAVIGTYLYVANNYNDTSGNYGNISQIDLSTNYVNYKWFTNTGLSGSTFMCAYNSALYISNPINNYISYFPVDPSNGYGEYTLQFATNVPTPGGLVINDNYIYAPSDASNSIIQIDLSNGTIINSNWSSGLSGLSSLAISDSYIYALSDASNSIIQIDLSNGSVVNPTWVTGFNNPIDIIVNNTDMYVSNNNNSIGLIEFENPAPAPSPAPISNICFLKNTPITTDQGIIPIEKINPSIHTINNKRIIAITKTISQDKYLICFGKHSLGFNCPNKKTIMSKDHKILYKGEMIEAYQFLDLYDKVTKVEYNGEILYNVLMDDYGKMKINKMICETLHPKNIIAQLYTSNLHDDYKNKLIVQMNNSIVQNDYTSYKKIAIRLI